MDKSRRGKTFIYLMGATILGWLLTSEIFPLSIILPPILFGVALTLSNEGYLRSKSSGAFVPALFFIIFMWGTLPFYGLGQSISGGNNYIVSTMGSLGAFTLVMLTVKLNIKHIKIRLPQIALLISLAFLSVIANQYADHGTSEMVVVIPIKRFDRTVFVYQLFMTVCILSSMEPDIELTNTVV